MAKEIKGKLYLIVFDGNPGGDWWSVFDAEGNEYEGDQFVKTYRAKAIDKKLHRGAPVGVELPEVVKRRAEWGSLYWYRSENHHNMTHSKDEGRIGF